MAFAKSFLEVIGEILLMFCVISWVVIWFGLTTIGVLIHSCSKVFYKLAGYSIDIAERMSELL